MSKQRSSSDSSPDGRLAGVDNSGDTASSSEPSSSPPPLSPPPPMASDASEPEMPNLLVSASTPDTPESGLPRGSSRRQPSPSADHSSPLDVSEKSQSAESTTVAGTKTKLEKEFPGTSSSSRESALEQVAGPSGVCSDSRRHERSKSVHSSDSSTPVDAPTGSSPSENAGRPPSKSSHLTDESQLRQHHSEIRSKKHGDALQRTQTEAIQKKQQRDVVTVSPVPHILASTTKRWVTVGTNTNRIEMRTVSTQTPLRFLVFASRQRRRTTSTTCSLSARRQRSSSRKTSNSRTSKVTKPLKRKSSSSESAKKRLAFRRKSQSDATCSTNGHTSEGGTPKRLAKKKRKVSKRLSATTRSPPEVRAQPLPGPFVRRRAAVTASERLEKMSSSSGEESAGQSVTSGQSSRSARRQPSPEWRPGSSSPLPICWPQPSVRSRGPTRQEDRKLGPAHRRSKSAETVTQRPEYAEFEEPSTSQRILLRPHSDPPKARKRKEITSETAAEDTDGGICKQDVRPTSEHASKAFRKRKSHSSSRGRSWIQKYASSKKSSKRNRRGRRKSSSNSLEEEPSGRSLVPQYQSCSSSATGTCRDETAGESDWDSKKELRQDTEKHVTSDKKKQLCRSDSESDRETSDSEFHTSEHGVPENQQVEKKDGYQAASNSGDGFKSHSPLPPEDEAQSRTNVKLESWRVPLDLSDESLIIHEDSTDFSVSVAESSAARTSDHKSVDDEVPVLQHPIVTLDAASLKEQHDVSVSEVPVQEPEFVGPEKDVTLDRAPALSPGTDSPIEAEVCPNVINKQSELSCVSERSIDLHTEDSSESYKSCTEYPEGNPSYQSCDEASTPDKCQESQPNYSLLKSQHEEQAVDPLQKVQHGDQSVEVEVAGNSSLEAPRVDEVARDLSMELQHRDVVAEDKSLEAQRGNDVAGDPLLKVQCEMTPTGDISVKVLHIAPHEETGASQTMRQVPDDSKTNRPTLPYVTLPCTIVNRDVSRSTLPMIPDFEQLPPQLLPVSLPAIAPPEGHEDKSEHEQTETEGYISLPPATVADAAPPEPCEERTQGETENGSKAQLPLPLVEYMATGYPVFADTVDSTITGAEAATGTATASNEETVTRAVPTFTSSTSSTNAVSGSSRLGLGRQPSPQKWPSEYRFRPPGAPGPSEYRFLPPGAQEPSEYRLRSPVTPGSNEHRFRLPGIPGPSEYRFHPTGAPGPRECRLCLPGAAGPSDYRFRPPGVPGSSEYRFLQPMAPLPIKSQYSRAIAPKSGRSKYLRPIAPKPRQYGYQWGMVPGPSGFRHQQPMALGSSEFRLQQPMAPGSSDFRPQQPMAPGSSEFRHQQPVAPGPSEFRQPMAPGPSEFRHQHTVAPGPSQYQHETSLADSLQTLVSSLGISDSDNDHGYLSTSSGEHQNTMLILYPTQWESVLMREPELPIVIGYIEGNSPDNTQASQTADTPNQGQALSQERDAGQPATTGNTDITVASGQQSEQQFKNRPLPTSHAHSVDVQEQHETAKDSTSQSEQSQTADITNQGQALSQEGDGRPDSADNSDVTVTSVQQSERQFQTHPVSTSGDVHLADVQEERETAKDSTSQSEQSQTADATNQGQALSQEGDDQPASTDNSGVTVTPVQQSERQFQNRPVSTTDDVHSADIKEQHDTAKASTSQIEQPLVSTGGTSHPSKGRASKKDRWLRKWEKETEQTTSSSEFDTEARRQELNSPNQETLMTEQSEAIEEFSSLQHDLERYYSGLKLSESGDGQSPQAGPSGERPPVSQRNRTQADTAASDVSQAQRDGSSTPEDTD